MMAEDQVVSEASVLKCRQIVGAELNDVVGKLESFIERERESLGHKEKIQVVIDGLERAESLASSANAVPEAAEQFRMWMPVLMVAYCLDGDYMSGKFLWQRMKSRENLVTEEFKSSFHLLKALIEMNHQHFYAVASQAMWSKLVQVFVDHLVRNYRANQIEVIGNLYGKVSVEKVTGYVGLDKNETLKLLLENQWKLVGEDTNDMEMSDEAMVTPPRSKSSSRPLANQSLAKIQQLAENVMQLQQHLSVNVNDLAEEVSNEQGGDFGNQQQAF